MATRFNPYQPFEATLGYQPDLDSALLQSQTGLTDLLQDILVNRARGSRDYGFQVDALQTDRAQAAQDAARQLGRLGVEEGRGREDFGIQREDIGIQRDRGFQDFGFRREDINRSADRGFEDISTNRSHGRARDAIASDAINRQFAQLANSQRQQRAQTDTHRGGAAIQAAQKRQSAEADTRAPLNLAASQRESALDIAQSRLGQDKDTDLSRLGVQEGRFGQDIDRSLAGVGRAESRFGEDIAYNREGIGLQGSRVESSLSKALTQAGSRYEDYNTDLTTQGSRAERDSAALARDIERRRVATGASAPRASNEFVDPQGRTYRTIQRGGYTYRVAPDGTVLSKFRSS